MLPPATPLCLLAFTFLLTLEQISASRCVVTKWRPWSECLGNCDFAQRVRNRDVVRPPFPEKNELTGDVVLRECPPLYEVEYCTPAVCDENPFDEKLKKRPLARSRVALPSSASQEQPVHGREFFRAIPASARPRARANAATLFSGRKDDCELGKQCCQIHRLLCPNGSRPQKVIRWFRKKDEAFCRSYDYPYCGEELEETETLLREEANCLEACFSDAEKNTWPSLRLIR